MFSNSKSIHIVNASADIVLLVALLIGTLVEASSSSSSSSSTDSAGSSSSLSQLSAASSHLSSDDSSSSLSGSSGSGITQEGSVEYQQTYRYVFLPRKTESQLEAQTYCEEIHGNLAVVRSGADIAQIKRDTWETNVSGFPDNKLFTAGNSDTLWTRFIWIGGTSTGADGDAWTWGYSGPGLNESVPFFFRSNSSCQQDDCYWSSGYPISQSGTSGLLLDRVTLEWINAPQLVSYSSNVLCQVPLDRYYKYVFIEGFNDAVTQSQANDICVDQEGFLATITGWSDMTLLYQDIKLGKSSSTLDLPSNPWLGGSDESVEGKWFWKYGPPTVRGKLFYDRSANQCFQHACFWNTNEPNDQNTEHQLVFLATRQDDSSKSKVWNDVGAGTRTSVLCQIPITDRYFYRKIDTNVSSQAAAEEVCEQVGGNLPALTSALDLLMFTKSTLLNSSTPVSLAANISTPWTPLPSDTTYYLGGRYNSSSNLWTWIHAPSEFTGLPIFDEENQECFLGNISTVWTHPSVLSVFGENIDSSKVLQESGDSACIWNHRRPASLLHGTPLMMSAEFSWYASVSLQPQLSTVICQLLNETALAWSAVSSRRNISDIMLNSLGDRMNRTYQTHVLVDSDGQGWGHVGSSAKADLFCRTQGGTLAAVTSIQDQNKAATSIESQSVNLAGIERVATGGTGRTEREEVVWRWSYGAIGTSGSPFSSSTDDRPSCTQDYCNWKENATVAAGAENVLMLSTNATAVRTVTSAPRNYTYVSLGLKNQKVSQSEANDLCVAKGGYLATLTSQDDLNNLKIDLDFSSVGRSWTDDITWLGGAEGSTKRWFWKYGPPEFKGRVFWDEAESFCLQSECFWETNEPNDHGTNGEDVLMMYNNLKWNDAHEDTYSTTNVLCQIPVPSTTVEVLGSRWESEALPTTTADLESSSSRNPFRAIMCQFENPYPENYSPNGYFYKVLDFDGNSVSAPVANQRCLDHFGYLASITSQEDLNQVEKDVGVKSNDRGKFADFPSGGVHLGGSDLYDEGEWLWHWSRPEIRGSTFYRTATKKCTQSNCFWATNEPNGNANENYLQLYESKEWNDSRNTQRGALCEIPNNASAVPYFYRYVLFDLSQFKVRSQLLTKSTSVTAADANDLCSQQGGYLATITSSQDLQYLTQDLALSGHLTYDSKSPEAGATIGTGAPWLGGSDDSSEGNWYWKYGPPEVRGKLFFSRSSRKCLQDNCFFAIGEPNDYSSGEDGLALRTDFAWNDISSSSSSTRGIFLCQIREWGIRSTPREPIPAASAQSAYRLQRFHGANFSQHAADALCRARGSWLATVITDEDSRNATEVISSKAPDGYVMTAGSNWNSTSGSGGNLWSWQYGAYGRRGKLIFGPPVAGNASTEETHHCVRKSFTYMGSYKDTSSRALRYGPHAYGYNQETCMEACSGYAYFALQDSGWCCCDNSFDHATKYDTSSFDCYPNGGAWCNALYSIQTTTESITTTATCLQDSCHWSSTCSAAEASITPLVLAIDSNQVTNNWASERELLPAGDSQDDVSWYLCQTFSDYEGFVGGDGSGSFEGDGSGSGDGWWWWTPAPTTSYVRYQYAEIRTNRRLSQNDAARTCADNGGYLATITSQEDYDALVIDLNLDRNDPELSSDHTWIGGSDDNTERIWYWKYGPPEVRGQQFYDHSTRRCLQEKCFWASNEPNDYSRGEDQMIIYKGLTWNDAADSTYSRLNVLCQVPTSGTISPDSWRNDDDRSSTRESSGSSVGVIIAVLVIAGLIVTTLIIACICCCCCAQRNNNNNNSNQPHPPTVVAGPAQVWNGGGRQEGDMREMQPVEGRVLNGGGEEAEHPANSPYYGYNPYQSASSPPLGYPSAPPAPQSREEDRPFSDLPPPAIDKQSQMGPPPSYAQAEGEEFDPGRGGRDASEDTEVEIVEDYLAGPSQSEIHIGVTTTTTAGATVVPVGGNPMGGRTCPSCSNTPSARTFKLIPCGHAEACAVCLANAIANPCPTCGSRPTGVEIITPDA